MGIATGAPFWLSIRPATAGAVPVDESGFQKIGGIDQWIAIQGQDRRNPVILYLHGGPGEALSPFLKEFAPWERDFTVVNWDQRGAGKTYEKNGKATPDVTMNRLADDGIALTRYVLKRLHKPKLILVGQSFGTILGLMVVKRAPELYYAFVGTGQVVNNALTMKYRERWARKEALAAHDIKGLKALDDVRSLSVNNWKRIAASRKWIMSPSDQAYLKIQTNFLGSPDHPKPQAKAWAEGYRFEASKVGEAGIAFNAMKVAASLPVPYVLIQGREDHVTPFAAAKAYFDKVQSRGKVFVPIKGGHYACFTNAGAFMDALNKYVRPLAV